MTEVFTYMGEGSIVVPNDVVRVRVHPSVTEIPDRAFFNRNNLEEVELCEGLLEIGHEAFSQCTSLKRIDIPSTVKVIRDYAFYECKSLDGVELGNDIERIGNYAFSNLGCKSSHLRIPPLVTTLPRCMVAHFSTCLFSIEIPEGVSRIEFCALASLGSLRNVAFPADSEIDDDALHICPELRQVLGVKDEDGVGSEGLDVVNALKRRFDNLPLHKLIYYQSYNNNTIDRLNGAMNVRSTLVQELLDISGNQQDCLGMTPLHILACSTAQELDLYRVWIEKYPDNLITEDAWGAVPLFYVIWGRVPNEIVQFLVQKYQSIYPDHEFDWNMMIETLGDAPKNTIQNLLDIQQESFPNQTIDWDTVLKNASAAPSSFNNYQQTSLESFRHLLEFSIAKRISLIGPQWRDNIMFLIQAFDDGSDPGLKMSYESSVKRQNFLTELETKLAQSETDYHNLKEACTLLELTLWKKEMSDKSQDEQGSSKKTKLDELSVPEQYRIGCGADEVIEHVLPYLLPGMVRQAPDSNEITFESDSDSDFDDESADESSDDLGDLSGDEFEFDY